MEEIQWKSPGLADREWMTSFFEAQPSRSCERTFANVYLWAGQYHVKYAVIEGALVFGSPKDRGRGMAYAYPAGEDPAVRRALERLMHDSVRLGSPFVLYNVTEENFAQMETWYPGQFQIAYSRDQADYVYETEALTTLAGKKLHSKRNHINKFKLLYPDWNYEPLTKENVGDCYQMASEWRRQNGCEDDPEKEAELCVTLNCLRLFCELGLTGGVLRAENRVAAFCVGEPLCEDTYVVHVEKAFADVEGAYTMINQQFVTHECQGYKYVNREEDTGALGLRKAKLSYHPAFLVKKGVVTQKDPASRNIFPEDGAEG